MAGLGSLGLVTALTLDLVPAFSIRQYVYEGLPTAMQLSHFDEIFGSAHSVSVFTNWRGDRHSQLWLKVRDEDGWRPALRWMDATLAGRQVHPVRAATPAMPPGSWGRRGHGTSGCPISGPGSRRAAGRSCNRSTSCPGRWRRARSTPWPP